MLFKEAESFDIGFVVFDSPGLDLFELFINELSKNKSFKILVIKDSDFSDEIERRSNVFFCGANEKYKIERCYLIVFPESNFPFEILTYYKGFRVLLPHGPDIPIKKSLKEYGGIFDFDFILAIREWIPFDDSLWRDSIPVELDYRNFRGTRVVPFGSPKLDYLKNSYEGGSDIIYHLSNLDIECQEKLQYLPSIIDSLLKIFPNKKLVFRPFPKDLEHPLIKSVRERFEEQKNFFFSDSKSYIYDYKNAGTFICHRQYSEHVFFEASNCPIVVLELEEYIKDPNYLSVAIKKAKPQLSKRPYFNQGASVDSFVDFYRQLRENSGSTLSGFPTFGMASNATTDERIYEAYLLGSQPYHWLAVKHFLIFSNVLSVKLILDSFSKTSDYNGSGLQSFFWSSSFEIIKSWFCVDKNKKYECELFEIFSAIENSYRVELLNTLGNEPDSWFSVNTFQSLNKKKEEKTLYLRGSNVAVVSLEDFFEEVDSIQIYGSSELAAKVIKKVPHPKKVARVVDSDPNKCGTRVEGVLIEDASSLNNKDGPVVITSLSSYEEILYSVSNNINEELEFFYFN
ncbi:hypothetical protein EAG18_09050 [Pseudoalteromonas sp. J010]|uniref:hypothetical protein n=1 Tax=Pseudoalteromonas sp. J010 TaxID=998465 RepID=UPI000F65509B|nr:hypothetical protein [Pseudoalteromonas sp. J010]RRS09040.1 hypothetical protein EAG18_09050 [Pseudoalteromonas sp. J010]